MQPTNKWLRVAPEYLQYLLLYRLPPAHLSSRYFLWQKSLQHALLTTQRPCLPHCLNLVSCWQHRVPRAHPITGCLSENNCKHFMASEIPPSYPQTGDQPHFDDTPPTYDDDTGILDVRHGGLSSQTKVGG